MGLKNIERTDAETVIKEVFVLRAVTHLNHVGSIMVCRRDTRDDVLHDDVYID